MSVLIVEDEPTIRHLIHQHLEGRGVPATDVGTVAAALEVLGQRSFDVVILDLSLPDGSGLNVLERLRQEGSEAHVIILSGAASEADRVGALQRGADDYVVKPFFVRELTARVLAVGRRRTSSTDTQLRVGALEIDVRKHEVTTDGAPVALTPKEFDLLAYLAARPGHVFSRDELLRAVWRSASQWQSEATVTEHIRRLRAKIETDPAHPRYLVTARGAGYRFDVPRAAADPEHGARSGSPHADAVGQLIHIDGVIEFADQAAAHLLGHDNPKDLVGKDAADLIAPQSQNAADRRLGLITAGVALRSEIIAAVLPDGTQCPLAVASAATTWKGQPARRLTLSPASDPSSRLRHLATGVFSQLSDAVLVTDPHFHIRSWNEAAERLYGWGQDEVIGRHIADILPRAPGWDADAAAHTLERVGRWNGTARQVTRDGSTIDVAASTTALRDDAGQAIGVVWVNRRRPPSPAPAHGALEGLGQEDLRRGMDERQFEVYYQPVVALDDSHVVGVEALIRWNHPQLGLLAPNAFLAVVETSGMMTELGGFVLEEACGQVAQWRRAGFDLELAVNISASQLAEPLLISRITAALSSSGLDAARLWLEVTETTLVQDVDKASDVLHLLVSDGLRIAIDDFGTGWASLTYLQRFPVHALKIDRSFVAGVDRNPHDVAIARSILSLGYELGLAVVAEGIESGLQHEALRLLGCSVGQGFLHGRPGPAAAVPLERAIRVEAAAQRGAERRRHRTQPMIGSPGAHTARTGGAATATSTLDSGSRGAPPGAGPFRDGLVADGELSGGVTAGTDAEAVVNLLRGLLRIGSARTAAELLHSAVRRLGATLVPASEAHPDALPVDVSLGEGPPLLAVAEPLSVTRMRLERILPRLVEDARHAIDLLRQTERLEEETQHDRLTGLANRRVLDRVLPRAGSGVVIMIDLDHFKRVNDTGGHAAGDAVLEGFGRLLVREVRATDTCCRVGGEEFVIVAADAEVSDALQLIGRIRAAWAKAAPQPVTFSAGVAAVSSPGGTSALLAADRALYRAKALGRDRTEVESDLGPEQ